MQRFKRDDVDLVTKWRHEIGHDDSDDGPPIAEAAVLACLEPDVAVVYGDDPISGIRNGVIGGSVIWAIIIAIFALFA